MHSLRHTLVFVVLAATSLVAPATARADKCGGDKLQSSGSSLAKTLK
jgi:hypothetical protein